MDSGDGGRPGRRRSGQLHSLLVVAQAPSLGREADGHPRLQRWGCWGRGGRMWKGARARPCPWHPDLGAPGGVTSIRTIGRLLLRASNALKREDDRLGSVNLQFKASSEGQRPPRKHLKGNSFPVVGGTGLNWRQGERNGMGRLNSLARRPSWGSLWGGSWKMHGGTGVPSLPPEDHSEAP